MKIRSNSTLAQLSQDQLALLYDWILSCRSLPDVQARALKPAPDGFGLHIHITTLRRFYQDYTAWVREQEPINAGATSPADLVAAAQSEVVHAIHGLAHSPSDPAHLRIVTTFLHQQREAALKEGFLELARQQTAATQERLALERDRMAEQRRQWEYNAARAALNHMPALMKIYHTDTTDNEDKIWAAREICFGKAPGETAPAAATSPETSPSNANA